MAKYKIEKLDGLYCVFENGRIIFSFNTLNEAKKEVEELYRNNKDSVYDKAIRNMDAYSYKSAYQDLERAYRMHKNNKPLLKDMIKQWADRHPEKEAKQALKDFEKQHGRMTDKAIKNMDAIIDYKDFKSAYKDLLRIYNKHKDNKRILKEKMNEWKSTHTERESTEAFKSFMKNMNLN